MMQTQSAEWFELVERMRATMVAADLQRMIRLIEERDLLYQQHLNAIDALVRSQYYVGDGLYAQHELTDDRAMFVELVECGRLIQVNEHEYQFVGD